MTRGRRPGLTVALVGPDGAGKTTIARRLEHEFDLPVAYVYMGVSAESSNHLLPTTRLVRAVRRRAGVVERGPRPPRPASQSRPSVVRSVRAGLRLANRIAEESYRQMIVSWHRAAGRVVLLDRHFFADYYIHDVDSTETLSLSRRVHGAFISKVLPRPHLIIYLDVPADELFRRKGEGTVELLESMRAGYRRLERVAPKFVSVDANRPLDEVIANVTDLIQIEVQTRRRDLTENYTKRG